MRISEEKETIQELRLLLFNPILINFTGTALDYLRNKAKDEKGTIKKEIQICIDDIDKYLAALHSVPIIPELHPTQDQREASWRRFNLLMADSFKVAMKDSIVGNIFPTSVILHGASSINHIIKGDGETSRMEIPMKSHGTSIEIPRQERFDPFGLDYTLRIFRVERFKNK